MGTANKPYRTLWRIIDDKITNFSTQRNSYDNLKSNEYYTRADAEYALNLTTKAENSSENKYKVCDGLNQIVKDTEELIIENTENKKVLEDIQNQYNIITGKNNEEIKEAIDSISESIDDFEELVEDINDEMDEINCFEKEEKEELKYIITPQCINLTYKDQSCTISKSATNYEEIIKLIISKEDPQTIINAIDVSTYIEESTDKLISIDTGYMEVEGERIPIALANGIMDALSKNKKKAVKTLKNFWNKLKLNPNEETIKNLFNFLKHQHFGILENGNFYCYKYVTSNMKDQYTKSIDNSPGAVVSMPREFVDHDNTTTCSRGLHVGTWGYVNHEETKVLVEVNPKHVCAVPNDYGYQKMRVCKYKVREVVTEPVKKGIIHT